MLKNFLGWMLQSDKPEEHPEDVAKKAAEALENLTQNVVQSIASCSSMDEKIKYLANLKSMKAARQIVRDSTDVDFLKSVSEATTLAKSLRDEAEKRISDFSKSVKVSNVERAMRRLEKNVCEAESALESEKWSTSFDVLNHMNEEWDTFLKTVNSADGFNELEKRYQKVNAGFKEKIKAQEITRHYRTLWEANCVRLNQLLAEVKSMPLDAVEAALVEIRADHDHLPAIPEAFAQQYEQQFQATLDKIRAYVCKHEEMLEKQKERHAEIQKLIEDLGALSAEEDVPSLKKVKAIEEQFEDLVKDLKGFDATVRSQFKIPFDACMERIDAQRESAKQARIERERQLELLASHLEEIVKIPLTQENVKAQLDACDKVLSEIEPLNILKKDEAYGRIKKAERAFKEMKQTFFATANEERWANYALKTKIAEKAEDYLKWIDEQTFFSEILEMNKALWEEWKNLGPTPSQVKDEIWTRFNSAMQGISKWLDQKRAEEDAQRQANLAEKQTIVEALEVLVATGFAQVKGAQKEFNALFEKWKSVGPVPAADRETINGRFKSALDAFNVQRNEYYDAIRNQFEQSQSIKERLIEDVQKLSEMTWRDGIRWVQDLRAEWKSAGFAGKKDEESLWNRFNAPIQAFYDRAAATENENLSAKIKVCETLEACVEIPEAEFNLKSADERVKNALESWRNAGPVPTEAVEDLMARFKSVMDRWHERRDAVVAQLNAVREANQSAKEAIIAEVEALLSSEAPQGEVSAKIKALQHDFKTIGYSFRECDEALSKQMSALCNQFFENRRASFDAQMQERRTNLQRKCEICVQLERLSESSTRAGDREELGHISIDALAKELEFILSVNTISERPQSREETLQAAKSLQAKWYEIGPVPREEQAAVNARYHAACDAIFGTRAKPKKTPPSAPTSAPTTDAPKSAESDAPTSNDSESMES